MKTKKRAVFMAAAVCALFAMLQGTAYGHAGGGSHGAAAAAAKSAQSNDGKLTVLVNGVPVQSAANHIGTDGKAYVSVQAFAELFGEEAAVSADRKTLSLRGKQIGAIRVVQGEPTARVRDLADAIGAQQIAWDADAREAYVLALPKGTIQLDPEVVPAMGEHWANPEAGDLPIGPIYGVYKGKLVFLEYMIAQDDFVTGKNHVNLEGMKGVPMPPIVQTDIEFQPEGHPGFEIPHYDLHFYFIADEEQQAIR
ncbi:hypothetical protein [Paenibacillus sp.]|uniref:hypothetical protein n=1 Tax=Paenibacillus sp. TaxID=58172 RepID=UPI002D565D0D|nr:hypothetical protein [Paenibacillus sp.]HZG87808.1 hypothetical protein [Paenibacillus sp.]